MRGRMRAERDPRVVRHVQPLVRVRRPRVRAFDAFHELPERRRGGGPQPERTVDVQPRTCFAGTVCDRIDVVERTGVHFARLGADDRRPVVDRELIDDQPPLVVGGHHVGRAHPEQPQRAVDGDVALRSDDDANHGCAVETALAELPARARAGCARGPRRAPSRAPSGSPSRTRTRRPPAARRDRAASRRRPPRQSQPPVRERTCRVLVPRRGQPVRRERGRQRPPDHEPVPPPARHPGDAGLGVGRELFDHDARVERFVLQRTLERRAQRVDVDVGEDGAFVERLEKLRRELARAPEQIARLAHPHQLYSGRLASPDALRARARRRRRPDGRRDRAGGRQRRDGASRCTTRSPARPTAALETMRKSLAKLAEKGGADPDEVLARVDAGRRRRPRRPDGRGRRRGRGREARRVPARRRDAPAGGGARVEHVVDPDLVARRGDAAARPRDRHALLQPGARAEARRGRPRPRDLRRDGARRSSRSRRSSARRPPRRTTSRGSSRTGS